MTARDNQLDLGAPLYGVVSSKSWGLEAFVSTIRHYPGRWIFFDENSDLQLERLRQLRVERLFFLHWSNKIGEEIVKEIECVCFHMTDLPYGRGGSPLQNLIVRGHRSTFLSALRMTEELDAGPIYFKRPLDLSGSAEEILRRATAVSAEMIREILERGTIPQPQEGVVTKFKRRKPSESRLPKLVDPSQIYDFIRMLDGEGYPAAFLECDGYRLEFTRAAIVHGCVEAKVTIKPLVE